MAKYKRLLCAILAFLLVFSLGSVASVPAHAIVLDPVAWLYPIWQAYAMQAGITVVTVGGDSFTQDSFTGLFNEWQAFEVSQGVQSAAQTISGFVDDSLNFVEVVAGSGTGGVLHTILKLEAGIVGPLSRFWNWITVDKLGGTSVDSVDFSSDLVLNPSISIPIMNSPSLSDLLAGGFVPFIHDFGSHYDRPIYLASTAPTLIFAVVQNGVVVGSYLISNESGVVSYYSVYSGSSDFPSSVGEFYLNSSTSGLYVYTWTTYPRNNFRIVDDSVIVVEDIDAAFDIAQDFFASSSPSGSISVAPAEGVDVLGFPDTRDPDYVPADTNIGWNVPYDPTADTNTYLDQAYQQALDNELDESGTIDDPVTGTDEVGEVGEYVVPGLSEVFPFCLPFDVYNFLSALAADPVAPSFTAELAFPEYLGGSQYIEIDLDNPTFNQLASIVRTMELLLFIIGLAYVTRSRFIRG